MNKFNMKRLIKDIKDLKVNPLENDGIFYKENENNILKGYALIIGPKDTLYENGNYLFEFSFTNNYPFEPPKVKFLTNDGTTRLHPNLYRNGKVCLSILNTWRGEQWTSCQTIGSILLTIISIFDNKPLLYEPGITEKYKDFDNYNKIIYYKNLEFSIFKLIKKKNVENILKNKNISNYFFKKIINNFEKEKNNIKKKIENLNNFKKYYKTQIYNMKINIDYKKLKKYKEY